MAKPDSWQTKPMPSDVAVLEYKAEFDSDEFNRISRGLIPEQMEDKWFIFLEGDILSFHRSWTGFCIYQIEFDQVGDMYSVRRATANRCRDQYEESSDLYDSKMLHFLISNLLLGQRESFPVPSNLPNTPRGAYQHHICGKGYPEVKIKLKRWWEFWK